MKNLKELFAKFKFKILILYYRYFPFSEWPVSSFATIDVSNICNLKCPLCPTGLNILKYKRQFMSLENFKIILGKLPKKVRYLLLYNWGEPFLNPDIIDIIKFAKQRKKYLFIDSNFSFDKKEEFFKNLIKSGLDELKLSIDGASQETYSKYRQGGNYNLVISNLEKLIKWKKKLKSKKPKIIWKFIVNRFNEDEIPKAQTICNTLGIEFKTDKIGLGDSLPDCHIKTSLKERKKYWLPKNEKYIYKYYTGKYKRLFNDSLCLYLFNNIFINPDGKVFPCCLLTDKKNIFGDLNKDSFEKIWQNEKYRSARNLFIKKISLPDKEIVCRQCHNFKKGKI